jgi:hypothetical protein
LYDFEYEFTHDIETDKWGFRFYDMNEKECHKWLAIVMKMRDFLIEKEKNG